MTLIYMSAVENAWRNGFNLFDGNDTKKLHAYDILCETSSNPWVILRIMQSGNIGDVGVV